MLGKNNQKLYDQQHADQHQHWALRKLSFGVASVLVSVSIYAGASTISANADTQTSGATETTASTNGSSASSLGSASSVSLNAQSASSATTNKSAANNASATATSAVASSATNEVASATTSNSAQSQSATSEKANSSAKQQNRSASQLLTALFAATSSSTQGTTADYTPTVTTSLPSDYPSQFNNDTYSEYFVFKEVKDELNDVSYYGAVKQDGSESGTVYIFAQSADGTISGPIKLASGESKSQNGITFNNYGDTYTVYENNKNNNILYYGYSSDGEKDSADRSQGNNLITGVLPTNGQFPLTINYYDKAGNLVSTKSDSQTVLAGKYIEVSAPEVVNGYVLTKTEGNQSGEVSEYTADKVGQTWKRHFTDAGLDADYTLNSGGSFTVKVYKNSQLVKTMTVPVDGTGQYQESNGGYLDTYAFPNPYIAGSTSLTYNYTQVGSIVPVDKKDGNKIGDEVPYTNDSDDPRKVKSNEPVPEIPGYHISTDQPNTDVDNGTVTPSHPTMDTKVVYVKDDTTETESKNVTRTINYVDKTTGNTVADSVTQTVTLTRTKTTNGETGKVTYSNWTIDGSWAEQTSPDLSSKGYDAPVFADGSDASKVAAATVNENSNDTTVTVYYPQHSDTTNETKTVKRTIEYLDKKTGEAIPSRLAQPVEQDVTLTRTVDTNKVTGEVTYGDWTVESGSWDEVVSPDLTNYGYTAPDKESVAAETVDGNTENSDVKVYYDHATTTVTPEDPKDPNTPINPNDPDSPKYTEDQTDVTKDASQTVHYTGAGDKTPSDKVQTQKDAFTRTVTIDKVTGKTISTTPWTGSKTFGTEDTPVVDGYHADKKVAGGLTATPENPNVEDTVTYAENGKIIPVDPNGNKIPDAPTPTYPTDPTDPTKVVPDEPVPDIPGYTPETPTVTPEDPGKDTPVVYNKQDGSLTVKYVDQDSNNAVLETKDLSGKYGDQITYTTTDTIKSLEDKGYVLVSDGFTGKAGSEFSDSNNGKTYLVVLKHGTTTVTPDNPKNPGEPINPNDPNGPKYTEDQTDVTRDATQTITYHYSDGSQPDTQTTSTEKNAFTRTVTVDKVTGKTISTTPWTGSHTFGKVNTPVIQGYHADKKTAGGLTATPDHPDVTDQVVYTPNGKIIPVDPNGNKIPDAPTPTYPTDPTDPTKVVPDEPVPDIPGYTPETPTVTPEDPGADTPVVYHTPMTPTPEKPTTPTTPGSAVPQAPTSGATPASPTAASTSQAPAKKLPQTGDQSATGLVAAGLATLLGLMGTGLKRRKQER